MIQNLWHTIRAYAQKNIGLVLLSKPKPIYFVYSGIGSAIVTILSLASAGLLFPLIHGVITNSFTFVRSVPGIGWLLTVFSIDAQNAVGVFIFLVICLYVLMIIKNILQYYTNVYTQVYAYASTVALRNTLFTTCLKLDKHFYDNHSIGSLHHMFVKIPTVLEAQYALLQRCSTQVILIIAYAVVMFFISWQLTLLILVVFPVIWFITYRLIARIHVLAHTADVWSLKMNNHVLERLLCMPIIQGFGKKEHEQETFAQTNAEEIGHITRAKRLIHLITPIEEMSVTTAAVCVAVGMAVLMSAQLVPHVSLLFMFFYLAFQVLRSVSVFNAIRVHSVQADPVTMHVRTLLDAPHQYMVPEGEKQMPPFASEISFKHVSFTYPASETAVLKDVSCVIPKGKIVALVGVTGSGKSTITNLLLRRYDCPPHTIFIDGVDIRSYTTESLLNQISFVSQDALLFSTTVEENILYGVSDTDDVAVRMHHVLEHYDARAVVHGINGGLSGIIGDQSANISGGQKKMLTLLRALLRKHEILILDEATNALDTITERALLRALQEDVRQHAKTVLLISHRLSTIAYADEIIFLEDGVIVESGTYQALLAKQGSFFAHWRAHHPDAPIPKQQQ